MARAKMTTRYSSLPHTPARAELAVAEARAILRETEPALYVAGHGGKAHLSYVVTTRDYATYRVACDCLAESLARFIEEAAQ